jgi:hypothetical protein
MIGDGGDRMEIPRRPADIYSGVLFIGAVAAVWGGALWVAIMVALD